MALMTIHLTLTEKLLTRQIFRCQEKPLLALMRSHMRRLKVAESSHTSIILALVGKFFFFFFYVHAPHINVFWPAGTCVIQKY